MSKINTTQNETDTISAPSITTAKLTAELWTGNDGDFNIVHAWGFHNLNDLVKAGMQLINDEIGTGEGDQARRDAGPHNLRQLWVSPVPEADAEFRDSWTPADRSAPGARQATWWEFTQPKPRLKDVLPRWR